VSVADVDKTIVNGGPDETEIKKALVVTRECYLSCMILRGSDNVIGHGILAGKYLAEYRDLLI
jgi:hypothetical protein